MFFFDLFDCPVCTFFIGELNIFFGKLAPVPEWVADFMIVLLFGSGTKGVVRAACLKCFITMSFESDMGPKVWASVG